MYDIRFTLFKETIRNHYRLHKRDLPWRRTANPYHIFVSEMMLQQTQVERVREKYVEFIRKFPDFSSLAKAPMAEILKEWQGLGYYRRARYLRESAKIITDKYNGEIPRDVHKLDVLPGIGKATAGAILTYAFNIPVVFIETNIRRIYLHFFFPDRKNVPDKAIEQMILKTLDGRNPREWYWALMDYGTVLSKLSENPNKRSKQYKKQSKFEGSDRALRGDIIRILLQKENITPGMLAEILGEPVSRVIRIIDEMKRDRMVKLEGNKVLLGD